ELLGYYTLSCSKLFLSFELLLTISVTPVLTEDLLPQTTVVVGGPLRCPFSPSDLS
ncbi:hypothetical protein HAX54_046367, partial [Datura stramonium]|nr:hypothetical protein [Datura stramonium]